MTFENYFNEKIDFSLQNKKKNIKILFLLGKYLTKAVLEREDLELAFVWNRTIEALQTDLDKK